MSGIFKNWKALEYAYPDEISLSLLNRDKERDIYNKLFNNDDIILWHSDVGWKSFTIIAVDTRARYMSIEHYPLYYRHSCNIFFKNVIDIKNMYKLKERY